MRLTRPISRETLESIAAGRYFPDLIRESDGWHARWRAFEETNSREVDAFVRRATLTRLSEDAEDQRHNTLHDAWLLALRSRTGLVRWNEADCQAFAKDLAEWRGYLTAENDPASRLTFALATQADAFEISCEMTLDEASLRKLGEATFVYAILRRLRRDRAFDSSANRVRLVAKLSRSEAEDFIRHESAQLIAAGYEVTGLLERASVAVSADVRAPDSTTPLAGPADFEMHLVVRVAGEVVSAEEIRFLLDQGSSLVYFRDHWIEVDRDILRAALRALERVSGRSLPPTEALGFALGLGGAGPLKLDEVRAHGWLRGLVNELRAAGRLTGLDSFAPPSTFLGSLRDYQKRGAAWLDFLTTHGFGALLADDMGLGKTIEVIAYLANLRAHTPALGPVLVVAPVTLLANWRHECARFVPAMRVSVHQGDARLRGSVFVRQAQANDIVVTSYPLLVRDHAIIRQVKWSVVVLDEAQAIKNPLTQVARAARALGAPRRLALTGTPIENSVADIWSLEEFLNPGLLGDRKSFEDRFVKPLKDSMKSAALGTLRHALEPFILRRLKTESEIASELGEKREMREYCVLSPAQREAYEQALDSYRRGDRRTGDIFALLTHLKLVCDGTGKFERLVGLLESIFAAGESALIFTQYAKVGVRLKAALEKQFGRHFPFLHGALSMRQRESEIAAFTESTEPAAFILSLRAGGFGLNLTKATHVIHYDRWWNPAVENQATDRAYRLGQHQTVWVHTFITEGTLEEHIDEILARKAQWAHRVVAEGESYLKQLSTAELEEAVKLT